MPRAHANDADPEPEIAGLGRGAWIALALLWAALSGLYITHPPGRFTLGGQAHGDGVYYYAYTRSLVFDRDLDLANDYALLGDPHGHGRGPTGHAENRFAMGTGVLWIPSMLVAHAVVQGASAAGWTDDAGDGTSRLYQRITLYGSLMLGMSAVVLSVRLATRYVGATLATTAGLTITLASPLGWYMVYQPSWPHAADAFAIAAFVGVWHQQRTARTWRVIVGLGALWGLAMLVRPQNVVFGVLPGFDLARAAWQGLRTHDRATLRSVGVSAALLLGAAALCFAPQMGIWASTYGTPLTIPQGPSFMRWGDSKWVEALFSSRNGLFAWTPLLGFSCVGLGWLGLHRAEARVTAGLLLLAFALQAYVNGSVDDWWGGWSFGGRRFVGCTVGFVLGTAYGLHAVHRFLTAHPRGVATTTVGLGVLVFASYNASMMWDYFHARLPRGQSQSLEPATQRWAARIVSGWYAVLGHPGAMPANLAFALSTGVSPGRYDAASGWELATDRGQRRGWDRISLPDARFCGAGFGPATPVDGLSASWVEREAVLLLPVRRATPLEAVLLLRPARPGAAVRVELHGHVLMDRILEEGWAWYRTSIPRDALRAGLNYAQITQRIPEPPPAMPRAVGTTGQATTVAIEVTSDPGRDAEVPLRVALDRTTIELVTRGVTAFAIAPRSATGLPGYHPLGTFETDHDVHAAARLARAIERLPAGQIVVLGLARSALARWSSDADQAIALLGGNVRLDPLRKDPAHRSIGYVLIGARGAAQGTALEAMTDDDPAVVRVGLPATERYEGVAWGKLTVWRSHLALPEILAGRTLLPAR
ncbi:MAG: hypothetical protein AAGF11_30690 [Myxococcota bacterium]